MNQGGDDGNAGIKVKMMGVREIRVGIRGISVEIRKIGVMMGM